MIAQLITDKIFIINRSELDGRIDATSYVSSFSYTSYKYPIVHLNEIVHINPSTSFENLDKESDISFIPMESVSDKDGIVSKLCTKRVHESKGFTRFQENDLIWAKITPCMQNGKSAVVRNLLQGYACGSTEFFVIRPKNTNVIIEYLHFLLRDKRILKSAQNFFGGSAGQQRVSREFLINLKIPLPPIQIQHKIVDLYNSCKTTKKQNEDRAKLLLESVDSYLLKELGITLPAISGTAKNKIFTVNFSDTLGSRLDPVFYNADLGHFSKGLYPMKPLNKIINSLKSGIGAGKQDQALDGNGIIQVRPTNMNEYRELDFTKNVYLPFDSKYELLEPDDVLFNNTNSQDLVGKTVIYKGGQPLTYSNHITVIKVKKEVLVPEYLWLILNLFQKHKIFYSMCTNWNNQSGIGIELLNTIAIPLPPLEIQNQIVNYIQIIREQARQLQTEADSLLENAKKEVEILILG